MFTMWDPEGNLHPIEFTQKNGKIIFETNHFSIYAMTFRLSIDNLALDNPTKAKKRRNYHYHLNCYLQMETQDLSNQRIK